MVSRLHRETENETTLESSPETINLGCKPCRRGEGGGVVNMTIEDVLTMDMTEVTDLHSLVFCNLSEMVA